MQRQRDQIPEPGPALGVRGKEVLGGEEPVVTGQGHPVASVHRAPQQGHAQCAGQAGRYRRGEEDPYVCAGPGAGDLRQGGDPGFRAGRHVGGGVALPVLVVEVACQQLGRVVGEHRVQAHMQLALSRLGPTQVPEDHLVGEREEHPLGVRLGLVPGVLLGRAPSGPAVLRAHPPVRVHIRAADEQCAEQGDLGLWGGGRVGVGQATALRHLGQRGRRRPFHRFGLLGHGVGCRHSEAFPEPPVLLRQLGDLLECDVEPDPQLGGVVPPGPVIHGSMIQKS